MIQIIVGYALFKALQAEIFILWRGLDTLPPHFTDNLCPSALWILQDFTQSFIV